MSLWSLILIGFAIFATGYAFGHEAGMNQEKQDRRRYNREDEED